MNSSIIDIYSLYRANYENMKPNGEYRKIAKRLAMMCEEFEKGLNKKQIKEFREIFNLHVDLEGATEEEHFKEGFKLGLQVGVEVFKE